MIDPSPHALHHITLCTPCIALCNCDCQLHVLDHAEPKLKVQAEQEVQWTFRCPQASSCTEANIVVIKASPDASNHHSLSLFLLNLF
jgi:hypothetical protein